MGLTAQCVRGATAWMGAGVFGALLATCIGTAKQAAGCRASRCGTWNSQFESCGTALPQALISVSHSVAIAPVVTANADACVLLHAAACRLEWRRKNQHKGIEDRVVSGSALG
jgi:hypothetical protein